MKKIFLLIPLTILIFNHQIAYADSPLTSTAISEAYKDVKIVKKAAKLDGKLTPRLLRYLTNKRKPIDVKIAIINELGWDYDGKKNHIYFFQFLQQKYGYKNVNEFLDQADGSTIICLAYIKALDNYFDVSDALSFAKRAKSKDKDSYSINIICALIEAQEALDRDWCKVYQLTNNVRLDESLSRDMNDAAIKIIFDYMDLYKGSCE